MTTKTRPLVGAGAVCAPREFRFVVDRGSQRPYCALLQAAFGGDHGLAEFFDSDLWLLVPDGQPVIFTATADEWRAYAATLRGRERRLKRRES